MNMIDKDKIITIEHYRVPVNNELPKCIICDIDGTASWMQNRSPFNYAKVYEDKVDLRMQQILRVFRNSGVKLIFLTGRNGTNECLKNTKRWIEDKLQFTDYELIARDKDDFSRDIVAKKGLYEKYIKGKYDVICAFEDRDSVSQMWREEGILCCQVANSIC